VIARSAGVNLLAVRAGRHPMREVTLAVKHFMDAGVAVHGIVFNAVNLSSGRFAGTTYHYQYAYRSEPQDD
jgi:tyrosine-protein kinase Etk/Wzc